MPFSELNALTCIVHGFSPWNCGSRLHRFLKTVEKFAEQVYLENKSARTFVRDAIGIGVQEVSPSKTLNYVGLNYESSSTSEEKHINERLFNVFVSTSAATTTGKASITIPGSVLSTTEERVHFALFTNTKLFHLKSAMKARSTVANNMVISAKIGNRAIANLSKHERITVQVQVPPGANLTSALCVYWDFTQNSKQFSCRQKSVV